MTRSSLLTLLSTTPILASYDKEACHLLPDSLITEQVLRYGDVEHIIAVIDVFGKEMTHTVWKTQMLSDKRLIKTNYYLGRIFLDDPIEVDELIKLAEKSPRYEKFRGASAGDPENA